MCVLERLAELLHPRLNFRRLERAAVFLREEGGEGFSIHEISRKCRPFFLHDQIMHTHDVRMDQLPAPLDLLPQLRERPIIAGHCIGQEMERNRGVELLVVGEPPRESGVTPERALEAISAGEGLAFFKGGGRGAEGSW